MSIRSIFRLMGMILALSTVHLTTRANAETIAVPECYACEQCHPELNCWECNGLVLSALTGCCGMGEGSTYCSSGDGGFNVICETGKQCSCDMQGNNCEPLE